MASWRQARALGAASVVVLSAALLAAPWRGHVDDVDAQLYQVLVRQMVATRSWIEPGIPPGQMHPFRDHLPFGFWPYIAADRIAGEKALPLVGACFSLAAVLLVMWSGSRLLGSEAGIAAGLVLALTDTFFLYGGRARLDPPLLCFTLIGAIPTLLERPGLRGWLVAAGSTAIAVLIKGPFGLAPLVCAVCARAVAERSIRHLALGTLAAIGATVPVAIFLWAADGSWWNGYVRMQLMGSALGTRTDGSLSPWAAVTSVAGRFWPGLPFVVLACVRLVRRRGEPRQGLVIALWSAFLLLALSLPRRKIWHHELVLYPALALLAGAGLAPFLVRIDPKRLAGGLAAAAAFTVAASTAGLGTLLLRPPCPPSGEFAREFDALPAGTKVPIVSGDPEWELIAGLAAERRLSPQRFSSLPVDGAVALIRDDMVPPLHPLWLESGHARGWVLLRKANARDSSAETQTR